MLPSHIEFHLPSWLVERLAAPLPAMADVDARISFVLDLARRNIEQATGGPFAAAVFDLEKGGLVAAGVNLVTSSGLSSAHAEVVALSLAQRSLGRFDLSPLGMQLVSSAEPCSMCLGAFHWSGLRSLAYSARDADVRAIGFDEGHKPAAWQEAARARGIEIVEDVQREAGRRVLSLYRSRQGPIYNAGQ